MLAFLLSFLGSCHPFVCCTGHSAILHHALAILSLALETLAQSSITSVHCRERSGVTTCLCTLGSQPSEMALWRSLSPAHFGWPAQAQYEVRKYLHFQLWLGKTMACIWEGSSQLKQWQFLCWFTPISLLWEFRRKDFWRRGRCSLSGYLCIAVLFQRTEE